MKGYNRFANGPTDREFLTRYYNKIVGTKKFKDALSKGIRPTGPKIQYYNNEVLQAWNELMFDMGKVSPQETAKNNKWGVAGQINSILEDLESDSYSYKLLDMNTFGGAIKFKEDFYATSYTRHIKPPVNPGEVIVSKRLNSFIEALGEQISQKYEIVVLKNNKITVVDSEENFYSLNITKKKEPLF